MNGRIVCLIAFAVFLVGSAALGFSNNAIITINDSPGEPGVGTATPYPSSIAVSGVSGAITKVTVALNVVRHTSADDMDVALVGPTGAKVMLMSDSGGQNDPAGATLTLDDTAANSLPDGTTITGGTYKPTNNARTSFCPTEANPDTFPPSGPGTGPFATTLSTFNPLNPNGTWNLYVVDDCKVDDGDIIQGWALNIFTQGGATAVAVSSLRSEASGHEAVVRWRTAQESQIAGFHLYRSRPGTPRVRLDSALIETRFKGGLHGGAYLYVDREWTATSRFTYHLQVVGRDGRRTWFGATTPQN